jgi:C1A family cysteine protease
MLAILALLLGVAVANPSVWHDEISTNWYNLDHKAAFEDWMATFGKEYGSVEEEGHRFLIFLKNWELINDHNVHGNATFTMRLNQFGDLTSDEFKYYVHGHGESCLLRSSRPLIRVIESSPDVPAPAAVDWQAAGYVTPVKNQGQCGSCWAFSATGCTESRTAVKNGQTGSAIVSLSEQQLVDCSGSEGNHGCNGGLMDYAFSYIQKNGGLCSESDYPYTARDGTCKASSCGTKNSPITGHSDVPHKDSTSLEAAVAAAPVSVGIEADQTAFQHYSSGVLTGTCGTHIDHGVLAVGYGTSGTQKYWKVKNSWGQSWGDKGYVLICKECGKNNGEGECGILMQASYDNAA